MTTQTSSKPASTKLCPTCGTRLSENATRCLVCGASLGSSSPAKAASKPVQGSRLPEITISLPAALGLLALFVSIGAVAVFFILKGNTPKSAALSPTQTATITTTPTLAASSTVTPTPTPELTATPLPPKDYTIVAGDSCSTIAGFFNVSINSIIQANTPKINSQCTNLVVGTTILVPQPTPTASPQPSVTLSSNQATQKACETVDYTVQENDTLGKIAANYAVSVEAIKNYNGLVNDNVYSGNTLTIPLCQRQLPNAPTPTATNPPPYAAPNLLLPADGAPFTLANDTVTLQWASVGELRTNEAYAVTIEDVTSGNGIKTVETVTDTKYILPATLRPTDSQPHIMRWSVVTVRQRGTTKENEPIWEPAGAPSVLRVFTWSGVPSQPTATP